MEATQTKENGMKQTQNDDLVLLRAPKERKGSKVVKPNAPLLVGPMLGSYMVLAVAMASCGSGYWVIAITEVNGKSKYVTWSTDWDHNCYGGRYFLKPKQAYKDFIDRIQGV